MGRLVLRTRKNRYRLYCNTMDAFITPPLKAWQMVHHLQTSHWKKDFKSCAIEALNDADELHFKEIRGQLDSYDSRYHNYKYYQKCAKESGWQSDKKLKSRLKEIADYYKKLEGK